MFVLSLSLVSRVLYQKKNDAKRVSLKVRLELSSFSLSLSVRVDSVRSRAAAVQSFFFPQKRERRRREEEKKK